MVKYYQSKGYECKYKDIIDIKVKDLKQKSTVIVEVECDICGEKKNIPLFRYNNNFNNKNMYVCSASCAQTKIKLTKLENHGDENFSNIKKRKETCKERYNNENYKNIEKKKETNIERYGVEHVIMNENIKNKRLETYKKLYGEEHPMKNNDIILKKKQTSKNKHGDKNYNNIQKTLKTIKNKQLQNIEKYNIKAINYQDFLFEVECDKGHNYKISFDLLYKRHKYNVEKCTICNPIGIKYSNSEYNLLQFIKENYNGEIIKNSRKIIKPYELDIFLPNLNLAFEYNGLWWHNELYKDKNYHKTKSDLCDKNNIQLIHIWEDNWIYKQDIVKSMILNKLGKTLNKIYARKCEIREIKNNDLIKQFLNNNHIQGFVGSSVKLGLYYNNELTSLMTFKKDNNNFELNRFCNKLNTNVIGGASKLFKYFTKNYNFYEIKTFADRTYSNGNLYFKMNFKIGKFIKPDYYYIVNGIRKHKFNFRKQKDNIKTEHEIMLEKNIYRIYDAGKYRFTYSL